MSVEEVAPPAHGSDYERAHYATTIRTAIGLPLADRVVAVWQRREVLRTLVERGLQQKYANSVLGYAWSLLEPAMFIATYFLLLKIFHKSYPMYPLFISSAILPWQWFASTVTGSTSALRSNARLITSVNLPREIYPLTDVAVRAVEFALSYPVLLVVALVYRARPSGYMALLPLALVLELMMCIGVALLLSALNTVVRDIQRGIGIVVRVLFYLVPVLYPLSNLSSSFAHALSYNPMVGILVIQRAAWMPQYWAGWHPVLYSIVGSVIVLFAGFSVFARLESAVLKEL
ncbi:MAG TPA: ABC transporter permease [Mycobacteriales bacterium]|nr:ABC transporter permease [Mycobacteriales bacterium]